MPAGVTLAPSTSPASPARCGAKTRRGAGTCGQRAGARTPHEGEGRCWLHGGLTPVRHGRYSTITRTEIRALVEAHAGDPDPLDVFPELALVRALTQDYVQRYDAWREALLAWHASYAQNAPAAFTADDADALRRVLEEYEAATGGEGELSDGARDDLRRARAMDASIRAATSGAAGTAKPREVLDLADAVRYAAEATKIVERVERARAANAVSRGDFLRVMTEMGRVVETFVRDLPTQARIREGWLTIRVA